MLKTEKNFSKIINFLNTAGKLKKTYRYLASKKMPKESVADHSWRLALMAFVIAKELKLKINIARAVNMALTHDLAEAITGDIDYLLIHKNQVLKKQKQLLEVMAINQFKRLLPIKVGREIYKLWCEYNEGYSPEAKYIKALDKIEALIYLIESGCKKHSYPELIPVYADKEVLQSPKLKPLLKEIKIRIKKEFKKCNIKWKKEFDII